MTQEELDALMSGDIGDIDDIEEEVLEESASEDESLESTDFEDELTQESEADIEAKHVEAGRFPLPATDENKMVHQLDDVTKESEEKASQIFDIIETVSNDLMDSEESAQSVIEVLNANIDLFGTLNQKFPHVEAFTTNLKLNEEALAKIEDSISVLQNSGDSLMSVMDIMQYQDIHRQKIERVINVMRSLSRYMNTLFESTVDDSKRVSSAQHIVGDNTENLASTDDIEALLEQFGQ